MEVIVKKHITISDDEFNSLVLTYCSGDKNLCYTCLQKGCTIWERFEAIIKFANRLIDEGLDADKINSVVKEFVKRNTAW